MKKIVASKICALALTTVLIPSLAFAATYECFGENTASSNAAACYSAREAAISCVVEQCYFDGHSGDDCHSRVRTRVEEQSNTRCYVIARIQVRR